MLRKTEEITQKQARERFFYNPETGSIYRYLRSGVCKEVGSFDDKGYVIVSVNGRPFKAHRLAFLIMVGYIPEFVDHKNQVKSDNRWDNLRGCTKSENGLNRGAQKNNRSGHKNIYKNKRSGKFCVRVCGGWIGTFDTIDEAILKRDNAVMASSKGKKR